MTVEIRRITEHDIVGFREATDAVARERRFLALIEAPPIEETAAFVRDNLARANPSFVAVDGERIVGWCDIVRNERRAIYRHRGTVGMGLLAAYRGQGIGRRLLQAAIDAAMAGGMSRIELTVRADNEVATKLYLRLGFEPEGYHRNTDCIDGVYYDTRSMALLA